MTLADVVGMLPFENTIVRRRVEVVRRVLQVLAPRAEPPLLTGLIRTESDWLLAKTGTAHRRRGQTYRVLINSFMYEGGAGYDAIAKFDSAGFDTEIHYRQPLVDWLLEQDSSASRPLSTALGRRTEESTRPWTYY